jgi:hypothetical protein
MAKKKEICCGTCGADAKFFHSRCCNAHFEGIIVDGRFGIVCEKCNKFVAWINIGGKQNEKESKKSKQ